MGLGKMTKEEEKRLKMDLFDVIADKREVININSIKMETEILYGIFKDAAVSENSEANDIFININMQSAIISYRLVPDLPIEFRIPFINGINFVTQILADTKDNEQFKELSVEHQKELVISLWNKTNEEINSNTNPIFASYIEDGIKSIIEIMHKENKKGK